MFFHFEMCEKRLHHIFNHHSDLKYLSWSLVIYRLEVIVMSSYWLLGIFILVLIGRFDKLGFGS